MENSPCKNCNVKKDSCKCIKWRKWFIGAFRETRRLFDSSLPSLNDEEIDLIYRKTSYDSRKNEN